MKKLLLVFTLFYSLLNVNAQSIDCGSGRYVNDVFLNVTKTVGVTFGQNSVPNYGAGTSSVKTLKFDFYEPAGDVAAKRPLIIFMFGGAFIQGERSDLDPFCLAFAKKGYAVATIDYRLIVNEQANLFFLLFNQHLVVDAVIKATSDLKAAIRYFKRDAASSNIYKIDTTKIILGGVSAGSIAALHTAYVDDINEDPALTAALTANGGLEGNTDLPAPDNLLSTYNSKGAVAVLNIAGGISDTSLIDSFNPPIYSSQGSADEVVPFNYGPISVNGVPTSIFLYGSNLITARANHIGLKNQFFPIAGGNHESPGQLANIIQIISETSAFMESTICGNTLPVTLTNFLVQSNSCTAELFWQSASENKSSHYDIEVSNDGTRFTRLATVESRNSTNGSSYSYSLPGYRNAAYFRLKMEDKDGRFTYSPVQRFAPACLPGIVIYPNPVRSTANITGLQSGVQVTMMNADGKLLFRQIASGTIMQIPLQSYTNGLYLVQVRDANGSVLSNSKLIKN